MNYRVAAFGFLYLDHEEAPGNMGLLDQQMALRWVQENIAAFGGNPGRVMLFGESAGAASISAHLVAPGSHSLFSSALLQSGSITNPWGSHSQETVFNVSYQVAKDLNCWWENDRRKTIDCLKKQPASDLNDKTLLLPLTTLDFAFVPISRDRNFFTIDAYEALAERRIKRCPIIIGIVQDEGSYWLPYYLEEYFKNVGVPEINRHVFVDSANKTFSVLPPLVRQAIMFEYCKS